MIIIISCDGLYFSPLSLCYFQRSVPKICAFIHQTRVNLSDSSKKKTLEMHERTQRLICIENSSTH